MSICKGCYREIDWIKRPNGKCMPVDPEPVFVREGEGNMIFIDETGKIVLGAQTEERTNTIGFVPHWATCPAADRFR